MITKSFICQECGQTLKSPLTKHTYKDCLKYKKGEK